MDGPMGIRPALRVHPDVVGRLQRPGVVAAFIESELGSIEARLGEAEQRLAALTHGLRRQRGSLRSTRAELAITHSTMQRRLALPAGRAAPDPPRKARKSRP